MSLEERLGPTLMNMLQTAPILISLAGHFILVNFAMLATMTATLDNETEYINGIWLPLTYIFYNVIFFQLGIWTLQKKNEILPVAVFIVAVVVSTISDVIMLAANYSNAIDYIDPLDNGFEHIWMFSSVMMMLNLVGKPFTIALACVSIFFRIRTSLSTGDGETDPGAYDSLPGHTGD